MVVVLPLLAENRATETNMALLFIENRRDRLKIKRVQQEFCNTPDREPENSRAIKNFQVPKCRLQCNRDRGEKRTIKMVKWVSGPYNTKQNPSTFEMKNEVIAPLYIEVKNISYILLNSRWDDNDRNVEVGNYSGSSKVVRKVFSILRLILSMIIMTKTTVLDVVKHIMDIVILFTN